MPKPIPRVVSTCVFRLRRQSGRQIRVGVFEVCAWRVSSLPLVLAFHDYFAMKRVRAIPQGPGPDGYPPSGFVGRSV
jgi:hypothetical protein